MSCYWFFKLPIVMAFGLGILNSAVSPSLMIPLVMKLHTLGYGLAKNIPTTLIGATTLNNIICIVGFSILTSIGTSSWTSA